MTMYFISAHYAANKLKEEKTGTAEAMFSFSRKLFRLNNDSEVEFVILESSRDAAIVSSLIKLGGGLAVIKPYPTPDVINLCCYSEPWMKQYIIFNTSYVYACCSVNRKLSLQEYSIGKTLSEEEYKKFDQDHLYVDKYEIHSLDDIEWTNAKELDLEDDIPLKPPDTSSKHSSNLQKSSEHPPKKCIVSVESRKVGKQGEKMDVLLSAEHYQEGSSSTFLSSNRKTCNTLSKNTAMDVAAALDIHPKDSVSQMGRDSMPSTSSSVEDSSETFQSNYSCHSLWDRSVRMWISDDDDEESD
ncbi:hypothetical protein J437_LFUL018239 [Ladona fulva]|uniref:BRCT domain-containing protein n=1 Tax=Ladona fulva TaxID=123851 RepID=A0A8K0P797_LADFU|nr:hypothetical protein J437_LFUL018239 [Ladona fulva]